MNKTYPCVVGHQIKELTAEQRDALAWRQSSSEEKIAVLLSRIEALESKVAKLLPDNAESSTPKGVTRTPG